MTSVQVIRHRTRSGKAIPQTALVTAECPPIDVDTAGLATKWRAVDELRPAERNAHTHAEKQITLIAASIRSFGFNDPIAVDPEDRIIEGHGRWLAAKAMGLTKVPTITLGHMPRPRNGPTSSLITKSRPRPAGMRSF